MAIAAGLTSFYSWRLVFMTFFGKRGDWAGHALRARRARHDDHAHDDAHGHGHGDHAAHESPLVMLVPLAVLAFGALFAGVVFRHWFIGDGFEGFWKQRAVPRPGQPHPRGHGDGAVARLAVADADDGRRLRRRLLHLHRRPPAPSALADANPLLYRFLLNKWYFDELYDCHVRAPGLLARPPVLEGRRRRHHRRLGPDGVAARVLDVTRNVVRLQTGYVYHYAFAMLLGVAAFVTWYLFGGCADVRLLASSPALLVPAARRRGLHPASLRGDDEATQQQRALDRAVDDARRPSCSSLVAWAQFDPASPASSSSSSTTGSAHGILYKLGVDGISMPFVLLTAFLMPFCIAASWNSIEKRVKEYMIAFLVLETLMIGVFCALDLVLFYLFFEGGLIPMFLIIGVWGGKRRVYAASSSSSTRCSARC